MPRPEVLGIIPSRFGAKRFPGKPLALIAGVPMIARVVRQALRARLLSRVLVATDDHRILRVAELAGAEGVLTPSALPSGSDRVAWVARKMKASLIVNIQGDEPVLDPSLIDAAVRVMLADPSVLMSTVVVPLVERREWLDPNIVKAVLSARDDAMYFSRAPIPFPREGGMPRAYKHLGLYGYRRSWLLRMIRLPQTPLEKTEKLEQLRALENGVAIRAAVAKGVTMSVDVPSDVGKVERYLKRKGGRP